VVIRSFSVDPVALKSRSQKLATGSRRPAHRAVLETDLISRTLVVRFRSPRRLQVGPQRACVPPSRALEFRHAYEMQGVREAPAAVEILFLVPRPLGPPDAQRRVANG